MFFGLFESRIGIGIVEGIDDCWRSGVRDNGWKRSRLRIGLLFHDIFLGVVFLFDFLELVDIFLYVGFEDHEITDEIVVVVPKSVEVAVVLEKTEFLFGCVMEDYSAIFGLKD